MTDQPKGHVDQTGLDPGGLYLGEVIDPSTHERTGEPLHYDAADLTTHGVIVGMTGSGKTGLGVVLLEEALLAGVPTLVIDPKGDMGNLLLAFPSLAGADFEPWIDQVAASRAGEDIATAAAETAETWEKGLASSGIGPDRIASLRAAADFTIYTPGSESGIPLNIIGSLRAPASADNETVADEIESFASSILGLVGIEADPLASREHILISNLISHAWQNGDDLDIAGLIGRIQEPPIRKLGVLDLDSFFPPSDRMTLALKLNGLIASPSFASWVLGAELDIESLLYGDGGKPRCAIVSIAHLTDAERQFVVTLLLSKLVTWMRRQSGTADLRALVYMDECFGFVPPTANPPAKKPILTILKQARAFGVGLVLSTQNPVDLDYKAISNAGTWMIGRLQTERDKARLVEGMASASGDVDIAEIDATIGGLDKRQFLLAGARAPVPSIFTTRWAMSYLPGPLTRDQIATLMDGARDAHAVSMTGPAGPKPPGEATGPDPSPGLADDETTSMPPVAEGISVAYLNPSAPWADTIGAARGSSRHAPAIAARVSLLFDDTKASLRHAEEWETVVFPLDAQSADMDAAVTVDYDDRDFTDIAPAPVRYVIGPAKIANKTFFSKAEAALKDHLYRHENLELERNATLGAYSRPGESADDFRQRCAQLADDAADADAAKLRKSLETKIDRLHDAVSAAEDKVREADSNVGGQRGDEIISGVGDILGSLLGGKKSTRSILGGLKRAGSKRRQRDKSAERLRTAENRLTEKLDQLEALESELVHALEDIQDEWDEAAAGIEPFVVPLEKTDIRVESLRLIWIPTS